MRERGRHLGRGGDAGVRRREAGSEPNRLSDQSPPNVLAGTSASKASGSPSWITQRAARPRSDAPAGQPAAAEARPAAPATRNTPSWGTIIFAGFILFSLVRACLQ